MEHADAIQLLFQTRIDPRDQLEVIGFAAWCLDAFELGGGRDLGEFLELWSFSSANVDACGTLAAANTVDCGPRDQITIQGDCTARVVVARDRIIDAVGITIGVDDGNDRNPKLLGFGHRNRFLVRVDHEQHVGCAAHVLDPAQRLVQLLSLTGEVQEFLFRAALAFTFENLL